MTSEAECRCKTTVAVLAGLHWPEVWRGSMQSVPREGDRIEVNGETLTVSSVIWGLPKRGGHTVVMIYAK